MEENFLDNLEYYKKKNKSKLELEPSNNFDISEYTIEFKNKSKKTLDKIENISELKKENLLNENKEVTNKIIQFKKKKFFRKKYFKKKKSR